MYPVWSRGGRFYKKPAEPIPRFPQGNLPRPQPIPARPFYPQTHETVSICSSPSRGRGTPTRGRGLNETHEADYRVSSPSPVKATPSWEGSLAEHIEDGAAQLVLLTEPSDVQGRCWCAKTRDNKTVVVHLTSLTFHWPQQYLGQSYRYRMEDLIRLSGLCSTLVLSYKDHIKIAWGNFVDRGVNQVTSEMLSGFLFGSFPKPHELYVAHRLLSEEEIYFTKDESARLSPQTAQTFRCRSLQEVSKIERERKAQQMYTENLSSFCDSVSLVLSDGKESEKWVQKWREPTYKLFIDKLVQTALSHDVDGDAKVYNDILLPLGVPRSPKDVFNLLVSMGIFKSYQNPNVLRYPRSLDMTPSQEEACRRVVPIDKDSILRKDLRSIQPTFAIDDSGSVEIDDSISLDVRQDGSTWICVHIADPSRMISPNDQLDRLARERVSSVFLPEKRFGMFHPSLSEKHFSLLPSRTNYALSFLAKLNSEGDIMEYEITPSLIDNVQSLTYLQADNRLSLPSVSADEEAESVETELRNIGALKKLYEFAMVRRNWRERNDATFVELPNPDISIKGDGEYIEVFRTDAWESPSRLMVAEYMILVGDICAQFAIKHQIPIPFRSQESQSLSAPFDPSAVVAVNGYQSPEFAKYIVGLMEHWHNKSKLRPAMCSVIPSPHVGLGLSAYCQATSPIRRFVCLTNYADELGETPPMHSEQLTAVIERIEQENSELNKLSSYSQRYWILRYFERQGSDRVFLALVLSVKPQQTPPQPREGRLQPRLHNVQVLFLDLGYKIHTSLSRTVPPQCGEIVHLMVKEVDAFYNDISFIDCTNT